MPHQVEIEVKERVAAPALTPAVAPGTVAVADRPAVASNGNGNGAAAGDKKKRRRRGRKRGTGLRAASAIGIALATLGGAEPAAYEGEVASVNGHGVFSRFWRWRPRRSYCSCSFHIHGMAEEVLLAIAIF